MKLSVIPVTNVEDMSNIPLPLISLTIWNESKKKLEEFLNNNDGTFRHIYNDSSVNVRAVKNIADNDPDMIYLRYGFNKLERKLKAELKLMQFEVRENCYPIMSNYPNLNKAPYFYVQIYYDKKVISVNSRINIPSSYPVFNDGKLNLDATRSHFFHENNRVALENVPEGTSIRNIIDWSSIEKSFSSKIYDIKKEYSELCSSIEN